MSEHQLAEVSEEFCRIILRHAGVDEAGVTFRQLYGGYSTTVYDVGGRYILRVALGARAAQHFARERAVLQRLRGLSGIPSVVAAGHLDDDKPMHYLLLGQLPGDNVFRLWLGASRSVQEGYVRGLVETVRQIHALPEPTVLVGHYETAVPRTGSWLGSHDAYLRSLLDRLRVRSYPPDLDDLIRAAEAYYTTHRDALADERGSRLLHGDLHLYNVIADEDRYSGIVDWEWTQGGETDFDLAHLIRWALFPVHVAEEELESQVSRQQFAHLIPLLLDAYPEVAEVRRLRERMTIYQVEHDLHHLTRHVGDRELPTQPRERLQAWLRERVLERYLE